MNTKLSTIAGIIGGLLIVLLLLPLSLGGTGSELFWLLFQLLLLALAASLYYAATHRSQSIKSRSLPIHGRHTRCRAPW